MYRTDPAFIPISRCGDSPVELVGAKARTLGLLWSNGVPVPGGFCVTTNALRRITEIDGAAQRIDDELDKAARAPVRLGEALAAIRRKLRDVELPDEFEHEFRAFVGELLSHGRVVVRSSAPSEDGADRSYAGVYESIIDLATVDDAVSALRQVWASLYSAKANYYRNGAFGTAMAVIVQQQVEADYSGVYFSHHPVTGEQAPFVEMARGLDAVTSGKGGQEEPHEGTRSLATTWAAHQDLEAAAAVARHLLDGPVDIEFATRGDAVQILQARPITARDRHEEVKTLRWALQEDAQEVRRLPLGGCRNLFMRQLLKHIPYRRICRSLGIDLFDLYYLAYRWSALEHDALGPFLDAVDQRYLRVNWGSTSIPVVDAEDLGKVLLLHRDANPVAEGVSAAQVGTVIAARSTGSAAVVGSGDLLVEAFPAGLRNLKSGAVVGSRYLVDPHGGLREARPASFAQRWELDPGALADPWREIPLAAPEELRLPGDVLDRLGTITRQLAERLGEVRIEWYLDERTVYVKDISIESASLDTSSSDVVSPGLLDGTAVRLPDLTALENPEITDAISVVEHQSHADLVGRAPLLAEVVTRLRAAGPAPIVVAPYPSLALIPLVQHAAGFVFERANLLCHTAIVLRENRIPSYIVPDALSRFTDGGRVLVRPPDGTGGGDWG